MNNFFKESNIEKNFLFIVITISFFAILISFILEYIFKIEPCPLCILQRFFIILVFIFSLFAFLIKFYSSVLKYIFLILGFLSSILGVIIAGRHVYIQNLPQNEFQSCGLSFEYLYHHLPLKELLTVVFQGSGDCSKVSAKFLFLSIAEWSLILFVVLTFIYIIGFILKFIKKEKGNKNDQFNRKFK